MDTLEAYIPVKQRLDVADDLGEHGITAQIVETAEHGDLCAIKVVGGTRETQGTIRSVLERHQLRLREAGDTDEN